jgi:hypothetical protein
MHWRMMLLATSCILTLLACAQGRTVRCGDFLSSAGHKPDTLEFIGCEEGVGFGLALLRARYQVRGSDAASVEEYLVRLAGIQPLRFHCCGWEAGGGPGGFDIRGNVYTVWMTSGETLEKEWGLIPWFYVDVELYLEDP